MRNCIFLFLSVCVFLAVNQHVAAETNKGPEEINLMDRYSIDGRKKPVIFNHRKHQSSLACIKCHTKEDGGSLRFPISQKDTISNDFHRKACWPCHKEMKVPLGIKCQTCHK